MGNTKSQQHNIPESMTTHDISTLLEPTINEMTNFINARTQQNPLQEPELHFSHQSQKRQLHTVAPCEEASKTRRY